jgi:hypothetical protein
MAGDMQNMLLLVTGDRFRIGHPSIPFVVRRYAARTHSQNRQIPGRVFASATEQDPVEKEAKTDAELEDMILQRLVIGGVFVSVRKDPLLGWRPTVVTAPKHARNAQELADKIAADLRKKFVLKD